MAERPRGTDKPFCPLQSDGCRTPQRGGEDWWIQRRFRLLEDYDFALRLSLLGPFAFIREPLVDLESRFRGKSVRMRLMKT